jgi:hypothetical protein
MEDVGTLYGRLVYIRQFDIFWTIGIFCGNLVYFSSFWYIVPRKIWQPRYKTSHPGMLPRNRPRLFFLPADSKLERSHFFCFFLSSIDQARVKGKFLLTKKVKNKNKKVVRCRR